MYSTVPCEIQPVDDLGHHEIEPVTPEQLLHGTR